MRYCEDEFINGIHSLLHITTLSARDFGYVLQITKRESLTRTIAFATFTKQDPQEA